jgi:hypothetical protein
MPVTSLTASNLGHLRAQNAAVGGTTADTVNFNGAPNSGYTIVIITTGATPGTVSISFARSVDGVLPADVAILDQAGSALAASSTYVLGLGNPNDYGGTVTMKATNAGTKFTVLNIG